MMKIYADNAATTKMSGTALEAMLPYMTEHFGNPSRAGGQGGLRGRESDRRFVHRRAAQRDHLHLRRQRGRQPGNPLGSAARREKGKKAHHFDQI